MKEKEPRQFLLTWESAAIVLASVGFGAILGSREARSRVGKELRLCYRGFKNVIRRRQETRRSEEERFKLQRLLRQVFPQGLRAEK